MLKIGPVEVRPGLLLAPMENVSDLPFRMICKELGADIVYSEFVSAEGLIREDVADPGFTGQKLDFLEAERPVGIQLYGSGEASMAGATQTASDRRPDLIDINCGCWVKNVALRGAGAGLLRDLPQMRQVVSSVVRTTDLPVTVKTRLGWDGSDIRIVEVARMLEQVGVRALTVHCRTRAQGNKGPPDHSWIPRIKAAVSIPVVLNGGVVTPEQVARAFAETGCDGVMIGRGAIQHPWICREARHFLETGQTLPPPGLQERAALCLRHLQLALTHRGERRALVGLRRHYAGYFKGFPGAAQLRAQLSRYGHLTEVVERLQALRAAPAGPPGADAAGPISPPPRH